MNASVRHLDTWHGRFEKCGTLLQYAVKEEKIDVVQILLQFGCVASNFGLSLFHSFLLRADPNAVTEEEEAFAFLAERLGTDQDSDWFGLRQVCAFT